MRHLAANVLSILIVLGIVLVGAVFYAQHAYRAPGPLERRLEVRITPYGEGQVLLIARDITEQLRQDRVRKDFVANVSHELRTPLTVLSGFVENLQAEDSRRLSGRPVILAPGDRLTIRRIFGHRYAPAVDALLAAFWVRFQRRDQRAAALMELGLSDPVDDATIKRTYRQLVMRHHPDRGGETERLQVINAALRALLGNR